MLNTNHPTPRKENFKHLNFSYQKSNYDYNKIIREVVKDRNDVVLNDVEDQIFKLINNKQVDIYDIVLNDKLHLSLEGHKIYFDIISNNINNHILKTFAT